MTSNIMPVSQLSHRRLLLTAHRENPIATGMKITSGRRVHRTWQVAFKKNSLSLTLDIRISYRDRREESPGIRMKGIVI
jgi:hypothetical protein